MSARITADMLRANRACKEQVQTFEAEWPDGAPVTLVAARRAIKLGLSLRWLRVLLDAPAGRAYVEAMVRADRTYSEMSAPADRAYGEARARAIVAGLLDTMRRRDTATKEIK